MRVDVGEKEILNVEGTTAVLEFIPKAEGRPIVVGQISLIACEHGKEKHGSSYNYFCTANTLFVECFVNLN